MAGCDEAVMVVSKQPMNWMTRTSEKMAQNRLGDVPLTYLVSSLAVPDGGIRALVSVASLSSPPCWHRMVASSSRAFVKDLQAQRQRGPRPVLAAIQSYNPIQLLM